MEAASNCVGSVGKSSTSVGPVKNGGKRNEYLRTGAGPINLTITERFLNSKVMRELAEFLGHILKYFTKFLLVKRTRKNSLIAINMEAIMKISLGISVWENVE